MSGRIRSGTGGWTFPPWRGTFYPAGLPHARELSHAAARLTAIEINATFHRLQAPKSFAKWRDETPGDFVFAVKASRYATNRRDLGEAGESIAKFMDQGLVELGDKLGPILWQLAATKRFDADEVARFFDLLPRSLAGRPVRHAVEALHESFADDRFRAMARAADVAIAHAEADGGGAIGQPARDFAYARFKQSREDVPTGYDEAGLDRVESLCREWSDGGQRDVFAFFIAGDKVRAPAAAEALIARMGA